MAALDFPNAPSNGQLFTAPNGTTYQWNGVLWVVYGTPGSVASQVATPTYDSTSAMLTDGGTAAFGAAYVMQITHGQQVFSRSFTAVDPTHPIEIDITLNIGTGSAGGAWNGGGALFIDGAPAAVAQNYATLNSGWFNPPNRIYWQGVLAAGAHTFSVRFGGSSLTFLNGAAGNPQGGGAIKSTMTIREIGIGAVGPQGPPGPTGGPVATPTIDTLNTAVTDAVFFAGANADAVMQITQGTQVFSRTFTAVDATHPIEVDSLLYVGAGGAALHIQCGLFIDGAVNAVAQAIVSTNAQWFNPLPMHWEGVLPAGAHTFTLRFASTSGSYLLRNDGSPRLGGGNIRNSFKIREVGVGQVGPQGAPGPAAGFLQTVDGRSNLWQPSKTGTYAYNTDVAPTQAAGALIYTTNITPLSATSKLKVEALVNVMGGTNAVVTLALFRDGVIVGSGSAIPGNDNWPIQVVIDRLLPSNAMTPTSFTLYIGTNSAVPVHINGTSAARVLGGSLYSGMTITERTV